MDALGRKLVRTDEFLWHLTSVSVGVAVVVAVFLYVPPGDHSIDVVVFSIDPFYPLVSLWTLYTCWAGIGLWSRYLDGDRD